MFGRIVAVLLVLGLVGQAVAAPAADAATPTESALVDGVDQPFLVEVMTAVVERPDVRLAPALPAVGAPLPRLHVPSVFRPPR